MNRRETYFIGREEFDNRYIVTINCVCNLVEVSYNQPKLPQFVWWNPDGITFANNLELSSAGNNLFIDRNNTVYVTDYVSKQIYLWNKDGTIKSTINWDSSLMPIGMFVAIDRNIYISDFITNEVQKWTLDATEGIFITHFRDDCYGLFVDIANYLYCSMTFEHIVVKKSLDDHTGRSIPVAGAGSAGSTSNMLNKPYGIFVDINFNVYVSDCENSRVQRFESNQRDGITVAGNINTPSINLQCPVAVFLDADDNLFIVDSDASRIIGSINHEFYCLAGCSGSDASLKGLRQPRSAAFDSYGNIFVADKSNNRIQKFTLMADASGK